MNRRYPERGDLHLERLGRGVAWFDTHDSLLEAASFVQAIEKRQGLRIAVPEEIAFETGWVCADGLGRMGRELAKNGYGRHLLSIVREDGSKNPSL